MLTIAALALFIGSAIVLQTVRRARAAEPLPKNTSAITPVSPSGLSVSSFYNARALPQSPRNNIFPRLIPSPAQSYL